MNKDVVLTELNQTEQQFLNISSNLNGSDGFDSVENWIEHILTSSQHLAKLFLLPTDRKMVEAVLTIITSNSSLTHPFANLISNRIATLTSATNDLRIHPLTSSMVLDAINNFQPLLKLTKKHNFYFERVKNVELIYKALRDNRLHIYKTNYNEPDIRVVLKTLQQDRSRENIEAVAYLLDFLYNQLKQNAQKNGFISQPRHAWWALLDLITECSGEWLDTNKEDLDTILFNSLDEGEYVPTASDPTNLVPELNSIYYEKIWVTIDLVRIYQSNISKYISFGTIVKLKEKIELNLKTLVREENDESIRSVQCKLLLLYEAISYCNYVEITAICDMPTINLSPKRIGKLLYCDDIIAKYITPKKVIHEFIKHPETWKKRPLTSMIISSPPGLGKSELAKQIGTEIDEVTSSQGKNFKLEFFAVGLDIASAEQLQTILKGLDSASTKDSVRLVVFDEIDKAPFDFYAPFLAYLESPPKDSALTFYFFCQSQFSTFTELNKYSNCLGNKSLRDFLTRMQLGHIDIPELKSSPQQKIFTTLGYALSQHNDLHFVSRACMRTVAFKDMQNNRDVIANFSREIKFDQQHLCLKDEAIDKTIETEWIKIID